MKYKFKLESETVFMMEFIGGNLTYAFWEKHPSSYLFNDILYYVMKLKLLGKQWRLYRNEA